MSFAIFDLDGTLALIDHRRHLVEKGHWAEFYARCVDDKPNWPIIYLAEDLIETGWFVEIWSGRSDEVRKETEQWLIAHGILLPFCELRMRQKGDYTPDNELKEKWLLEIPELHRPTLVVDDRDKVVKMWRSHGITCLQCAEGAF